MHLPVDVLWDSFQILAITNKAEVNVCVQDFACTYVFISFV